jgi:hypothetical protein
MIYAAARRKLGATWQSIAQQLGLSASGLQRWSARATGETRLRRVRIERRQIPAPSAAQGTAGSLVLVSPQGFRLEGLGVSEALALLHDLG